MKGRWLKKRTSVTYKDKRASITQQVGYAGEWLCSLKMVCAAGRIAHASRLSSAEPHSNSLQLLGIFLTLFYYIYIINIMKIEAFNKNISNISVGI